MAGAPLTWYLPSVTTTSSKAASSIEAAIRRARSCTFSAALIIAEPPTTRLRLPPVPKPIGALAVSPCRTTTWS